MNISCDMFRKLLMTSAELSTKMSLTNSWPQRRNLLLALMEFRTAFTDVWESWVRGICFAHTNMCCRVVLFLRFLPTTMEGFFDHREALRPLTLCNCDYKILTTAIRRSLQWCTMRCVHTSQRCTTSIQMTDNIFEIDTTALAHVACAPRESGILLTDFAAAHSCVNHSLLYLLAC